MFKKKGKKKVKKYIKFCPKCRSINIKIRNVGGSAGILFGAPTIYTCQNCGFSNYAFPEIEKDKLKNVKSKTRIQEKNF
ncbi:MAG: hypothetical protein QXP53_00630 [Candidatus Pacearchaeota archaeon]